MGPAKSVYFYLYVIIDMFQRSVVGWLLSPIGKAPPGSRVVRRDATTKHPPRKGQITLHAVPRRHDASRAKGPRTVSPISAVTKSTAGRTLQMTNPFSEGHFKTMKYQPQFTNASV